MRQHLEKWWEVLADAGKALKIQEGDLNALHMRAYAYYRLGDHEMALRHQREGLRLDPEHKLRSNRTACSRKFKRALTEPRHTRTRGGTRLPPTNSVPARRLTRSTASSTKA